jgi:hypothetical protein
MHPIVAPWRLDNNDSDLLSFRVKDVVFLGRRLVIRHGAIALRSDALAARERSTA